MSRFVRILIVVAIAAPVLVSTSGSAVACSCIRVPAHKVLAQADAIVAGHVIEERTVDTMNTHSTVAVDGVYKGHVDARLVLNANIGSGGGSSCAVLYPVGSKIDPLVLQRLDDGTYQIQICALVSRAQIVKLVGDARPPPPDTASASAPEVPLPASQDAGVSWPAVLGGLALAIVGIALLLRRSSRRTRPEEPSPFDQIGTAPPSEE